MSIAKKKIKLTQTTAQAKKTNRAAQKLGHSPQKQGLKGDIPEHHFRNLCKEVESFVAIQNINGTNCKTLYKKLGARLKNVMFGDQELPHEYGRTLLRRLLADVPISLNA